MKQLVFKVLNSLWGLIPKRMQVLFLESKHNTGMLDYRDADIKMKYDSLDSMMRLTSCSKEPETINWITSYFKKGEVFYDVGANVGAYSLVAASKIPELTVYAFEPISSTFNLLLNNIYVNGLEDRIYGINLPLSSTSHFDTFEIMNLSSGSASHSGLEHDQLENGQPIKQIVYAVKLDEFIKEMNIPFPHHLKIDVDGHEYNILEGSEDLLKDSTLRTVQIEMNSSDAHFEKTKELFEAHGFNLEKVNNHPKGNTTDLLFVR